MLGFRLQRLMTQGLRDLKLVDSTQGMVPLPEPASVRRGFDCVCESVGAPSAFVGAKQEGIDGTPLEDPSPEVVPQPPNPQPQRPLFAETCKICPKPRHRRRLLSVTFTRSAMTPCREQQLQMTRRPPRPAARSSQLHRMSSRR